MIPKIKILSRTITVTLAEQMSLVEVEQFIDHLTKAVNSCGGKEYSLLNNAEKKSFSELSAVKALSVGMRSVLATTPPERVAIYRPQNDYQNEEYRDRPDQVQIFTDLNEAESWLQPKKQHSSSM